MDLLDFDPEPLYFDDPLAPEVEALLRAAADGYAEEEAEAHLMRAYFLAPEQLTVLVALDPLDRIGGRALLAVARARQPGAVPMDVA